MMQQTSLIAYFFNFSKLQSNELIVYDVIKTVNGITNHEISQYLGWEINRVTGRTNSLIKKGLIDIKEKRPDLYTKNLSNSYSCV